MVNLPSGVYASLGDTYTHPCQNNQRPNGSLDNCTVTPPIFVVDWLSRDFADIFDDATLERSRLPPQGRHRAQEDSIPYQGGSGSKP
jgi:hypothetical protein